MHCPPTAKKVCSRCRCVRDLAKSQGSLQVLCVEQLARNHSAEELKTMVNPVLKEDYTRRYTRPIGKTLERRQLLMEELKDFYFMAQEYHALVDESGAMWLFNHWEKNFFWVQRLGIPGWPLKPLTAFSERPKTFYPRLKLRTVNYAFWQGELAVQALYDA